MSMHVGLSMPACFASPDALAHASHYVFFCFLDRRVTMASNVSGRPKSKQSPPAGPTIDLAASGTLTGGVAGEERASVDDRLDGLGHGLGGCRCRRWWGHGGG